MILPQKIKTPLIFTVFQISFFYFFPRQNPWSTPVATYLSPFTNFRENVKYLISQKLLDIREIWGLPRTQCQKVVVKLWLRKHCISISHEHFKINTLSTLAQHWTNVASQSTAVDSEQEGSPLACRLKWSSQSTQQDWLMILLVLIRDSKFFTSLFLGETMRKSFMTCDLYCKKIYFTLTDSHKNEQRTENNFTLTYYIICVTHKVLIC